MPLNWRRNPPDGSVPLPDVELGATYLIAVRDYKDENDKSKGYMWVYELVEATSFGWHTDDSFFVVDATYYIPCSELSPGDPDATP